MYPSSSLISIPINYQTLMYCSSSIPTVLCAKEFMKFCQEEEGGCEPVHENMKKINLGQFST